LPSLLAAPGLVLRRWEPADSESLVRCANDRRVWINLTDQFPHPYTPTDARAWIARCSDQPEPAGQLAIALDGAAIGGIGVDRGSDIRRLTGEVGYWLGQPFWGRGLATAALLRFTQYVFERFDFLRLQAGVLDYNPASARVLEKAGYAFEARRRSAIVKDGRIADELVYYRLR
jgi:RimJ/RimL family protein N-acetyltransferase